MFVTGNKERGATLLIILIGMTAMAIAIGFLTKKYEDNLKRHLSYQLKRQQQGIAHGLAEAMSCPATMGAYNADNRCPVGTVLPIRLVGKPVSSASGPDGSTPLSSDWYAKLTCGNNDLILSLAHYRKGNFTKDPLTGNLFNFDSPGSRVSDKPSGLEICPGYFGSGVQSVAQYTMSIATLQDFAAVRWGENGTISNVIHTCDSRLGLIAELQSAVLPSYWRKGGTLGTANVLNSYGQYTLQYFRTYYDAEGFSGRKLKADWLAPHAAAAHLGMISCDRFCVYNAPQRYRQGFITKCEPSASPLAFGTFSRNSNVSQATCLCIR